MRAAEIAARLAQSVESVAGYLLPGGKREGAEWCAGSVVGDEGHSLKLRLTGPKAGVWRDFATDDGGDLLDLFAARSGLAIADAMREAAAWLGIPALSVERVREHPVRALAIPAGAVSIADGAVMRWLTDTRKLPLDSIRAYRLAERNGKLMMPAFAPDGKLLFAKYRAVPLKEFASEKGGTSCLFGWQAIPKQARRIVICEGEPDAVAWHAYGYPALSPTNGASATNWIDVEFDNLERFDEIFVAYDSDEAGKKGARAVAERLGLERCRIVTLPHNKDCNEALIEGVDKQEIDESIAKAKFCDPDDLRRVNDSREEVLAFFAGGAKKIGVELPWSKAEGKFCFGAAELTILAGATGSGKTELVNQFTLEAMVQGLRTCVASMEYSNTRWLSKIIRQAAGFPNPTAQYLGEAMDWLDERLFLCGARGTAKTQRIFDVFRYAAKRYGCRWFVVDNLAKCGIAEDDYQGQKDLVDQLGDFANAFRSHVVLCAHLRKGEREDRETSLLDIKGTGGITDMADNVLLIKRNRRKERAQAKGETLLDEKPDAYLFCDKVRDGDSEPSFGLWFDEKSHQFVGWDSPTASKRYVAWQQSAGVAA